MNKTLLNTNTICMIVFSIGIVSSVAIIIAAVVAVAYMLDIAMTALSQIANNISSLYGHADSFTQLIVICLLAFLFYKLARAFLRMACKGVATW